MKHQFVYKIVTALMLTVTSLKTVLADKGDDDRISVQYSVRPLTLNKKPIITKEDQWWYDYQSSNNNIVQYVHDLSKSNSEAAAWFLLTGGKYGFANRQATTEEANLLIAAVNNIAPIFTKIDSNYKWITPNSFDNPIGKNHYEIILKKSQEAALNLIRPAPSPVKTFENKLQEITEKAGKERQEIISTLAREKEEREARDRQREEDHEKHLEAMDKNYVRLSRFYTPEGLQQTKQHKKAMEDFRDYHKGLLEVLNRELKYTRSDLNGLIGYEMASDLPTIQRGLKVATDKMPWKIATLLGLFLDSKRFDHYDEALKNLSTKLYADLDENQRKGSAEYKAIEDKFKDVEIEWVKQYDLIKKITNYEEERKAKQEWSKKYNEAKDRMKADRSASFRNTESIKDALYKTKWEEEKRLKAEKDQAERDERPVLTQQSIDQYGSVRKANQERLKAKYAEWQTKRSSLEALGIATSSEIIETVNNAFSGLIATADMRDGLIETLEKRAESLEYQQRGQEILKRWKTKELQVKARLYNKNFRKGMSNDNLNQFVVSVVKEGYTFERIESAIIEQLTN